jgi:hypothetical protein
MRNLLEYPVTFNETLDTVKQLREANAYPNCGIGSLTPLILSQLDKFLRSAAGSAAYEDFLFEERA